MMLYLLSVTLVVTTINVCILKNVLDRMLRIERELKESHVSQARVSAELEKLFTEQIEAVHDLANRAQASTVTYTSRVEELNNKIAGLSLKR